MASASSVAVSITCEQGWEGAPRDGLGTRVTVPWLLNAPAANVCRAFAECPALSQMLPVESRHLRPRSPGRWGLSLRDLVRGEADCLVPCHAGGGGDPADPAPCWTASLTRIRAVSQAPHR